MKEIEFNDLKKIDLKIVEDIDRVCRENNINYTIIGGTLIGAIRHKGFIPWDDDIDIAMLRDDYNRFIEIYSNEKGEDFELFNNKLNKEYYYQYSRACDKNTVVVEDVMKPINGLGVFVDIFPIDYISNKNIDKKLSKINFYVKGLAAKTTKKEMTKNRLKYILKKIIYFRSYQYYFDKVQALSQIENNNINECENAGVLVCGTGKKDIFPKEIFKKYVYLDFENQKLMSVENYECFLTHRFGEYMKLPPKEEQITHHTMASYWRNDKKGD